MSDVPTVSTSTESASAVSISSSSLDKSDIESYDGITVTNFVEPYDDSDDESNLSWTSSQYSRETVILGNRSESEISDVETTVLRDRVSGEKLNVKKTKQDKCSTPILTTAPQHPYDIESQMNAIMIDVENVEHLKRLEEVRKELDYIESTEWMYQPLDLSIR